jgi:hypothetical protein
MARTPAAARSRRLQQINEAAIRDPSATGAEKVTRPSSAGDKVIVGCKLDIGYYDIYLCREEIVSENTQTGPRDVKRFTPVRENTVRLRGTAYPRGTPPEGFPPPPMIVDGAALTFGVSRDFWERWAAQNHRNPLVINRMIFAQASLPDAKAEAKELAGQVSGLAPINPKGDKRMPKPNRSDISAVETEESRAAKVDRAGAAAAAMTQGAAMDPQELDLPDGMV